MDGNGRWAQAKSRPRLFGHRAGAETAKTIAIAARDMGIRYLTLYAFSTENWKRPMAEVQGIFGILGEFFDREARILASYGIRIVAIGDRSQIPKAALAAVESAEEITRSCDHITVNMALNYGGRWDIVQAVQRLAREVQSGVLSPSQIDEGLVSSRLSTAGQPDPDLLIRTGGDRRVSNFLLWQLAYTELLVTPTLWPDFTPADLAGAVGEYETRNRRFGGVVTPGR